MKTPLDPKKTIIVVKKDGREVGRVAATAPHANDYLMELARFHKGTTVDYEQDDTGVWNLLAKPL